MKKKRASLYRGVAGIFLALMVVLGVVAQVADSWADKVNELLGASSATFKRSAKAEDYRFPSDYASASDLILDEIALNTRLAAEGSVALKGLPELPGKNVTLFGMRSGKRMQFGGSMGELTNAASAVQLASAMAASGFTVNPQMVKFYEDMDKDYEPSRASGGNIVSSYVDDNGENNQGAEINEAKKVLAYEVTKLVHGEEAAVQAEAAAKSLFTGGAAGGDIPTLTVTAEELAEDARISTLLVRSGLCKSQSDARKQIEQNAVSAGNDKVSDPAAVLNAAQIGAEGILLKKGKKGFCRVILG